MPDNNLSNDTAFDATMFQDVTRSVDQLCTQMSIANVIVPKFSSYSDVFDWMTEYELVTTTLSNDQKLALLAKAFPPGRHRAWYEMELLPMIKDKVSWDSIKTKIIHRFSDAEDRDRHFTKLRELKFDPSSGQKLLEFVEDMLYSYKKAHPLNHSEENSVHFVKAAIPSTMKASLVLIPGYKDAKKEDELKKAIRQYDMSLGGTESASKGERIDTSELASILKEMINGIKKEGEATRSSILAAFKTNETRPYTRINRYSRENSPRRYEDQAQPRVSNQDYRDYRSRYPRSNSPRGNEAQTSSRYSNMARNNYSERRSPSPKPYNNTNQQDKKVEPSKSETEKQKVEAFNSDAYYDRFGKPPTPSSFVIDGEVLPIIVDTGATISCIPERGKLMRNHNIKALPANLNVILANDNVTHIDKKARITIKPAGSGDPPQIASFYIANDAETVLGHEALLGLNILKLFDLDIRFYKNEVKMYHRGYCIGQQCKVPDNYKGSIKIDNRINELNLEESLSTLLKRYKAVFANIGSKPIQGKPMRIYTLHQRPIYSKQRHYTPEEIDAMKEHVTELRKKGIIEPTESGYAATSRIIPKKSGSGRLVVNYIPLNAVTLRDSYVLPHVSDILGCLQGKKYFTTMDCAQGFYQILVDSRDRHKTAFSTPLGNFQFVRCPFGARNSCAKFQREMNNIFAEGLFTKCAIYVDDILVWGETKEDHDNNLEWVLKQCDRYNVKVKLDKCKFRKEEVEYLGFSITGSSIKPLESKVKSLNKHEPPKTKTELRSIVGKLNFYSRFIPNYSKLSEPFRELFRSNRDFQWKPYHLKALYDILTALSNAPTQILVPRSEHKTIELHITDDSIEALCLSNSESLICRASRFLSPAEANYSYVERQLLALVLAINKFRIWLEPENFTVRVPTKGLEKAIKLIKRPERIDNWLLRLPVGFDTYKFEVKESLLTIPPYKIKDHVPQEVYYVDGACKNNGKKNCRASWAVCAEFDRTLAYSGFVEESPSNNSAELMAAIKACEIAKSKGQTEITIVTDSRYLHSSATQWIDKWRNNDWLDHKRKPVVNRDLFKKLMYGKEGLQIEWIHVKGHANSIGNIRVDAMARSLLDDNAEVLGAMSIQGSNLQANSKEIEDLKEKLSSQTIPNLVTENDVVYYVDKRLPEEDQLRIYVPTSARRWLLNLAHDDTIYGGHLGIKKTHRKLVRFWWPKMHYDVETYIKSCDLCQRFKNPIGLPPGYLHSIPVSRVFEHVHIDMVGPIKSTCRGNNYIITATDAFSKWCFARPCQNIRTTEVIKFLDECILAVHGKPEVIITDRGSQFTSAEWSSYVKKLGIKHNLTAPYHPQANGIDERLNGTLARILRAYVDVQQEDWDEQLKWALYIYNTTVHESTGYSPYQILHGLDPRSPLKHSSDKQLDDNDSLERIRRCIREKAHELNKEAQVNQQKEYNGRHKSCKFKLGDLVMLRERAVPNYLSKKLHPKWDRLLIVEKILGEDDNPRALSVIDCEDQTRRVVAVNEVKPYIARAREKSPEKEKGEAQELVNERDWNSPEFYMDNGPLIDTRTSISPNNSLDLLEDNEFQPTTSSPRRVTINDNAMTFFYNPEDQVTQTTELVEETLEVTNEPKRKSPYEVDFIIDDSVKDPIYKQPASKIPQSDRVLRSQLKKRQQEELSNASKLAADPTNHSEVSWTTATENDATMTDESTQRSYTTQEDNSTTPIENPPCNDQAEVSDNLIDLSEITIANRQQELSIDFNDTSEETIVDEDATLIDM